MNEEYKETVRENIVQDPSFLRWAIDADDTIEQFDAYLAGDLLIQVKDSSGNLYIKRIPNEERNNPEYKGLRFPEPLMTTEGRNRVKSILYPLVSKIPALSELSTQKIEEIVGEEIEAAAQEFAMNYEKYFHDVSAFELIMKQMAHIMMVSLLRSKHAGLRQAITERVQMTVQEGPKKGFKLPFVDKGWR